MLRAVKVKDYMTASLVTFEPGMDVLKAVHMLVENGISGAPVVDEHGSLIGVLSERDCLYVALHAGYHEFHGGKVSEYMSDQVATVEADASIVDVAEMFIRDDYRRYPVVSNNRLVGQISRHDVLRALEQLW